MSDPGSQTKVEVRAFEAVLLALTPLDNQTRARVLAYVQLRFGGTVEQLPGGGPPPLPKEDLTQEEQTKTDIADVRTLKEKKQPKSAVEMAVLVGYYVSEIAKPPERKSTFGTADLTRYFKQAGYRLPTQPNVILHRAKTAGYLDSGARGQYSLNPVGYNLVTHGLPRAGTGARKATRKSSSRKKVLSRTARSTKGAGRKKTTGRAKPKQTRKKP